MIHVLSIGNSFSQDAQRYLHELAKSEGVELQTVNLYIGGCSLAMHFRNLKGDKREYTLEVNGQSAEGFRVSIREALTARSWDVVTLQQASHESFREETYEPYLKVLAEAVREYCPKARLLLHQTWGYESGSERIRQHGFENYDDMFAEVMCCCDRAAAEINANGIIPGGLAFQFALQKGIEKIHRDTFHASLGTGRFLLALVWYGCITGRDVSQVHFDRFDEPVDAREYGIAKLDSGPRNGRTARRRPPEPPVCGNVLRPWNPRFWRGHSIYSFTGLIPRCLQRSERRSQERIPRSLLRGGSLTMPE